MMANKKVYIVIVTYNSMKWMEKCLKSLRASQYPLHIIVVDNCSKDNTVSYLSEQKDVELIVNKQNKGFGQANNQGIKFALEQGADYCFLLNQDAYIHPDTIEKLIETHLQFPSAGILTPVHLNGNGAGLDPYYRNFVLPTSDAFLTDACIGEVKRYYDVDLVPAAGWFIPKNTLEKIGGFDPLFFHYGEDDNYMQRLRYHQMPIVMDRQAFIRHDRESTVGNAKVYLNKKNRRELLILASDINYSKGYIIQKIGKQFFANLSLHFFYLLGRKFGAMWNFFGDYWYLYANRKRLRVSRENNRTLQKNWL